MEELRLNFERRLALKEEPWPSRFASILGNCIFPSLRFVRLGSIDGSQDEWITFFQRHSDTLREVSLCDTVVRDDGNWERIFKQSFQNSHPLKLEIEHLYEGWDGLEDLWDYAHRWTSLDNRAGGGWLLCTLTHCYPLGRNFEPWCWQEGYAATL